MRVLWISAIVVLLDQATKATVLATMYKHQSIPLLGDWLRLTFTENSGMAFGITIGPPGTVTVLALIATCLVAFYLWEVRRAYAPYRASLALIFGGAVGNMIDRVFYAELLGYGNLFTGHVVDFIHVSLWQGFIPDIVPLIGGGYMELFPIWNVADMAIVVGVVGVLGFHHGFYARMSRSLEEGDEDGTELAGVEDGASADGASAGAASPTAGRPADREPGMAPGVPGTHPASNGQPPSALRDRPAGDDAGAASGEADASAADTPGAAGSEPEEGAGASNAGATSDAMGENVPADSGPPSVPDVRAPRSEPNDPAPDDEAGAADEAGTAEADTAEADTAEADTAEAGAGEESGEPRGSGEPEGEGASRTREP